MLVATLVVCGVGGGAGSGAVPATVHWVPFVASCGAAVVMQVAEQTPLEVTGCRVRWLAAVRGMVVVLGRVLHVWLAVLWA